MKRLFWLGMGVAVGVLVVRAVTKKAQSYSPQGIAAAARDSGRNVVDSVRNFVDDVREGMHEREEQLRTAFAEGLPVDAVLDRELGDEFADRLADEDFDEVFGEPDDEDKDKDREATR